MEEYILNGVGKKMRTGYLNGSVSKDKILSMYNKNKKEADNFSFFGHNLLLISLLKFQYGLYPRLKAIPSLVEFFSLQKYC